MIGSWLHRLRTATVSALGVTILLGTPLLAQADQGKWWKPKEGGQRAETRDRGWNRGNQGPQPGRAQGDRGGAWQGPGGGAWRDRSGGGGGVWRDRQLRDRIIVRDRNFGDRRITGGITYRDRRFSGRGILGGYSSWRGVPVRRDVLEFRDRRYPGGFFRARRLYCAPRFYGGFVYVRPVRYFIAANAFFGPISIRARIVRPHYLYGCNFCDARFDTYEAYAYHVAHCPYRPDDCQISASNWDDSDYDSSWDGPYQTDDQGYDDQGYDDQGYDDQGYDDQGCNEDYH